MQRLLDMAKEGTFKYAGRDNQPDQLLVSGKAGIISIHPACAATW
jgi:hypothetical protein